MLVSLAPLSTPEKQNKSIQLFHLCSHTHQLNAALRDNISAQTHTPETRLALHRQNSCVRMQDRYEHLQHPRSSTHAPIPEGDQLSLAWAVLYQSIQGSLSFASLALQRPLNATEQWLSYSRTASDMSIHCPQSLSISGLQLLKAALTSLNTCLRRRTCSSL